MLHCEATTPNPVLESSLIEDLPLSSDVLANKMEAELFDVEHTKLASPWPPCEGKLNEFLPDSEYTLLLYNCPSVAVLPCLTLVVKVETETS
jgi:hypothetical protein